MRVERQPPNSLLSKEGPSLGNCFAANLPGFGTLLVIDKAGGGCRVTLDIPNNGIVHRLDDGSVTIVRTGRNGGIGTEIEIDRELADQYNLATGDIVAGETEPIHGGEPPVEREEDLAWEREERDEPAALRGETVPTWLVTRTTPAERIVSIRRINGLPLDEALDRPSARLKRNSHERAAPNRWVPLALSAGDTTGRMLDFSAPLGLGYAGIVYGPHGSGLTRTLRAVAQGVTVQAPDCMVFMLLMRARGEEITDWRRRFPAGEVIVCPTGQQGATAEQTLRIADLTLAAAQRQTELGRHVILLVDSLTGLWGAMLEGEEADAQREADRSWSRQRIREWMQAAGSFSGEGLLGSGLGGSLTIVASVWQQGIDTEAEEEGEIHPHLRLLEHVLAETSWRVALAGSLAADRLFPAIDTARCLSNREENFLPEPLFQQLIAARQALAEISMPARHHSLFDALDDTSDLPALLQFLSQPSTS